MTRTSLAGSEPLPVVCVVDDDASVREALASLFRSVGLEVATFANAADFLARDNADAPGCLVLDVRLPGVSGLDFQAQLAAMDNRLPVIFMTGHGDIPMSVRAMKAGALDFLSKPFRDQDMLDAVTAAIIEGALKRKPQVTDPALLERLESLTPREREVMQLSASGLTSAEIADKLGMSARTVNQHVDNVADKLGTRNRAHTVAEIVKRGLL